MSLELDRLEQRIIGVLIEKELTVPESYPLTVNALVAGCNQKNNRDPQMQVEEYEVEGALRALMDRGWVSRQERDGGRVHRFAHEVRDQLAVGQPELAILCELLCRGPQAPGALRTRASRMADLASPEVVEQHLGALASRPVPFVVQLERQPREQQARWAHCLGPRDAEQADSPSHAPTAAPAPAPAATAPLREAPALATQGRPVDTDLTQERIDLLEQAVVELRDRLDRLENRFG